MNTAQTILSQIKTIDPLALFAWGAEELTIMDDGLNFKTSGMTPWKGYVYIKYNQGTDLYDVRFMRFRRSNVIEDVAQEGVFAEDLVSVIDRKVG